MKAVYIFDNWESFAYFSLKTHIEFYGFDGYVVFGKIHKSLATYSQDTRMSVVIDFVTISSYDVSCTYESLIFYCSGFE